MRTNTAKARTVLPDDGLVPLESILLTEELTRRPVRSPDYATENRALVALAQALADSPRSIFQTLAETMLDVVRCDSAGVSLLAKDGKRFHCPAIAGAWHPHAGGTPRDFGPCGDVLGRNAPLLFNRWERRYPDLLAATPPVEEGLFVPFYVQGKAVGTIWAVAHNDRRKFDAEDLRQLESLGRFASAAYQVAASVDAREQRRAALNLMEDAVQSRRAMERLNAALRDGERRFREMIDALPAAIYTTDADGRLTHFNPAAVEFSGRSPELGTDHWCVSWKLYRADGTPLPHDECPMAVALKEGRIVRGVEAIAERPDGRRIWFTPYPTPLFDREGRVVGGINMLVDITERKRAEEATTRLAAIVTSSKDAIISKSLDGVITSWNQGAEHLFGYSVEEAVGQPVTLLIPEDHLDEEPRILERIRRGDVIEHFETVRRRKDGRLLDISLTVSPIRDAAGRVVGASKVARDITERKRIDATLRESEEFCRTVLESSPDCVKVLDADGRLVMMNTTGLCLLEIDDFTPFGGKEWELLWPPDSQDRVAAAVAAAKGGTTDRFQAFCPTAKGTPKWWDVIVAPVRGSGGRIHRIVSVSRDITEQRGMENQLRQHAADLSEADRRKTEFLAMLAHELRNPLAPIRNAVQVLRLAGGNGPAVQSASAMMERQVGQMVRLVDDLLDVSRVSRGRIELRRGRVELASVAHQAVEATRSLYEDMGHELTVTVQPPPIYLNADPTRLTQVVGNLLNNACKFTDKGGRISLTVARESGQAVIRVRDSGVGIAADHLPRVFDMFMQVDTSLERSVSGLGIGLTLVKSLVEMHDGTVEVHSAGLGEGSEFVVRLPVLTEKPDSIPPEPAVAEPPPAVTRRVLVVDDNRDSAESLATLLELTGHETRTAFDGLEAVEAAAAFEPEVVLMDIGLPKLNGYEACRQIREQPWGKGMVLVALTGWGQEEDRQKSRDAGFDGHLVKPVEHAALTKLLAGSQVTR